MKKVFTIIGPTASGKTYLTYKLARRIKEETSVIPEIISADSRQVYKEMRVASAQPSEKILKRFKHYFIDELHPEIDFNAGDFGKTARHIIKEIFNEHKIPLVTGGSGLYIRSLVHGLFELENIKNNGNGLRSNLKQKEIRANLNEELEKHGAEKLYKKLFKVDPDAAAKMSPSTPRRIIRALEVYYLTGIPISHQHKKNIPVEYEFKQYGLLWDREKLYERINERVEIMLKEGLMEEVTILRMKGYHYKTFNSLNTVGIREAFDYFDGLTGYDEMIELIKQNTRRYAKRQMTWFKKDRSIEWLEVKKEKDLENAVDEIFDKINKAYPYLMWR